ncbi:cell division protein FtsQ/DivIB [Glaciimonas immobilis]|uniref:Cell division protein FtsQ n=1 Tax=Glaciimonas immobilis TaxID=728004 RepID=A0A840RTV4_9BURK|nr:cell division protein FtsQ/DivIB [Glaciimonas immobilis]KAF3999675.1 FtsQ-type POTRA domain-containing protein [Glaciimonas immobilis]MBB5200114.1 cell division protein FtsQ [Glaciimonas immobilis]
MWQDIKILNATSNALFGLALLALMAGGAWWLAQRPMFALKVIRVESAEKSDLRRVNPLTIRASALPRIKGNFFTANLDSVRVAFESVPWVRKASVQREWPNQLVVTIEEHQPLGTWDDDGRLLSVKGDLFIANLDEAEEDGELLKFGGPNGSEKDVLARFADFQKWFAPIKLTPTDVELSPRYAWSVKLNNGMTVALGREQTRATLHDRVNRLIEIYPQLLARLQDRIESVDMRYPNGLALKASSLGAELNNKK